MNDKRPVTTASNDWSDGNPEAAYKGIALFLIVLGLVCFFIVLKFQPEKPIEKQFKTPIDGKYVETIADPIKDYWSIKGTIGDFTAGIAGTLFSLAGFSLLYLSFKKQTEANITQLNAYNHDKVEGRFFELIKLHRDNVNELSFTIYHLEEKIENGHNIKVRVPVNFENRHFFVAILHQFKEAYNELDYMFYNWPESEIYCSDYLAKVKSNATLIERNIDLVKYAKIDIIYLIVFFGLSTDGQVTIYSLLKNKYEDAFVARVLSLAGLKPKKDSDYWYKWKNIQKAENSVEVANEIINARAENRQDVDDIFCMMKLNDRLFPVKAYYSNNYEKYYGGHQFRLGHYFRHIYHTISFINDNTDLTSKEQYNYVKHLRGQFSTNEQILIFLNSISQLGRVWELEDKKSSGAVQRWKQIMSDYMVIKNIPNNEILPGIKLSEFYPDIVYEGFDALKNN